MEIKEKLRSNIYIYYFSIITLTISLSLPHSVLTVLLLDKGFDLSQIMLIQTGFSIAVLLTEYPSGILADFISKKKIFLISKFLLIFNYLGVLYSDSFFVIFAAWFMYGASVGLTSGSLDAELINNLKTFNQSKLGKFISLSNQLSFISLIIGSTLGSFLYYRIDVEFYYLSIILTLITIFIVAVFFKSIHDYEQKKTKFNFNAIKKQIKYGFQEINNNTYIRVIIILTVFSQFFFQTHFQLWQAFLLSNSIDQGYFYIFYIVFQLIGILVYNIPIEKVKFKIPKGLLLISGVFISILPILLIIENELMSIIIYILFVFLFTLTGYVCIYIFSKQISKERISSLTSFKSTCGRIGATLSLVFSSLLLNFITLQYVIMINFIISIFSSILTILYFSFKRRNNI